ATGLLLCAFTGGAMAAEIRVLSAGAVEPGLRAAAAAFKKQSGHDVNIAFNTAPEIRKRIGGGEAFDVVIAPPAALEEFAATGKLTVDRVASGGWGWGLRSGPAPPCLISRAAKRPKARCSRPIRSSSTAPPAATSSRICPRKW